MARELGRGRVVEHSRERLTRIELSVRVLQLFERPFQVEVARGEDASGHRDEVRHERDMNLTVPAELAQLLSQLRKVAVAADRIGADRLVDLAEMDPNAGGPPGPTDARLGVDHEIGRGKPSRHRGCEGEDRRGRVTARHGDECSVPQLALMELGQPEHRLGEQVRLGMLLPVPDRVLRRIVQTKIRAHVDHPGARADPPGRFARANVVRQAAEHDIDPVGIRFRAELALQAEQRKNLGVSLTRVRPRGELAELHAGMASEQVHQCHPGIAVGPGHGRLHGLRHGRMSIQGTA